MLSYRQPVRIDPSLKITVRVLPPIPEDFKYRFPQLSSRSLHLRSKRKVYISAFHNIVVDDNQAKLLEEIRTDCQELEKQRQLTEFGEGQLFLIRMLNAQ